MMPEHIAAGIFAIACIGVFLFLWKGNSYQQDASEKMELILKNQKEYNERLTAIEASFKAYSNGLSALENKMSDLSQNVMHRNAEAMQKAQQIGSTLSQEHDKSKKQIKELGEILQSTIKSTNHAVSELSEANKRCNNSLTGLQETCSKLQQQQLWLKRNMTASKEPQRIEVEIIPHQKKKQPSNAIIKKLNEAKENSKELL